MIKMSEFKEDNSRLNRLNRGLYSRKTPDILDKGVEGIRPREEEPTSNEWTSKEGSRFDVLASKLSHVAEKQHSFARKFLTLSAVLFIISAGIATFVFLGGMNLISSKNVDIQVVGPVAVGGGQDANFDVVIKNGNNTDLEAVKLTVEYPEGSRSVEDLTKDLVSQSFDLGTIKSGDEGKQEVSAYLFGEKDEIKKFVVTVEYRIKNSSALFYKEKIHEIVISSAPIIVTSTYPKEVNSNQDITFSVEVASNSNDSINNFLLNVEYPFGFTFKSSTPEPSHANNTWKMSLGKGEKRTVKINGTIVGVDNEERVFKVNSGTASVDDERNIGVLFTTSKEGVLVKKPFVGIDLRVGGSASNSVISSGGSVEANLNLRNNLSDRIFNMNIEAILSGSAFSENAVTAGSGGFFRSVDDTIVWDSRSNQNLGDLPPGESIGLNFRFTPLGYQSVPSGASPQINVKLRITGDRILSSGATEKIELTEEKVLRLATNVNLATKSVRSEGNIENSGPVPPKVNTPTTYTVVWSLSNTFNTAGSIEVVATLPPYVEWKDIVSPATEDVTYNPTSKSVVWRVPQLVAGAGYKSSPKQVSFQVSFLPSTSQINSAPEIVGGAVLNGTDRVTNTSITETGPAVTTKFNDSSFKDGYDKVGQ